MPKSNAKASTVDFSALNSFMARQVEVVGLTDANVAFWVRVFPPATIKPFAWAWVFLLYSTGIEYITTGAFGSGAAPKGLSPKQAIMNLGGTEKEPHYHIVCSDLLLRRNGNPLSFFAEFDNKRRGWRTEFIPSIHLVSAKERREIFDAASRVISQTVIGNYEQPQHGGRHRDPANEWAYSEVRAGRAPKDIHAEWLRRIGPRVELLANELDSFNKAIRPPKLPRRKK